MHGLATDRPCACEACSTGVEAAEGRSTGVYLSGYALFLFSCTVWRQTDRAHAKHAALALGRPKAVALALSIYAVYRATKKVKDSYERK